MATTNGTRFQGKAGKGSVKDEAGPQTVNWVWALDVSFLAANTNRKM